MWNNFIAYNNFIKSVEEGKLIKPNFIITVSKTYCILQTTNTWTVRNGTTGQSDSKPVDSNSAPRVASRGTAVSRDRGDRPIAQADGGEIINSGAWRVGSLFRFPLRFAAICGAFGSIPIINTVCGGVLSGYVPLLFLDAVILTRVSKTYILVLVNARNH